MNANRLSRVLLTITAALILIVSTAHADVTCKDGTTSTISGRGACSHHGGMVNSGTADKTAAETNRAPTDRGDQDATGAPPTVSCKDGVQSKSGRGACSHHGGVADAAPNGRSGPANDAVQSDAGEPAGVRCKDGSRSTKSGQGACSHHGGRATAGGATAPMNEGARGDDASGGGKTVKTGGKHADPTGATAQCKDGTYSHSQHGSACSHHGGVAKSL